MTVPGRVSGSASVGIAEASPGSGSVSLASPKSRILTKPSFETMTFSGFRSRCTMPAPCALASPSAICAAIPRILRTGIGPETTSSRSVLPSTSSIAMYAISPSRPISWIVTMLGWFSAEAERASCSKRASRSRSVASDSGSTLSATSRPRRVSLAR